ncbi:hypothetical protein EZV62_026406 [Acer yangbiense]|uniref:Uncharacterized protein n=1 Tax=Acer yangbiense TaxID=1000413 RepID=A0A5C7GS35_9ROSI|nr:hypothetical protein EZV62_026406 [Acer yangbiense]
MAVNLKPFSVFYSKKKYTQDFLVFTISLPYPVNDFLLVSINQTTIQFCQSTCS